MRNKTLGVAAAIAAIMPLSLDAAPTRQANLAVSVNVTSNCSITGGTLDFGSYVSGQKDDKNGQATISFTDCGPGTLSFKLDGGREKSIKNRRMSSGSNKLAYQLFRDNARKNVWGETDDALNVQLPQTGSDVVTVYGRIAGEQSAPQGTYTDNILVSVTF